MNTGINITIYFDIVVGNFSAYCFTKCRRSYGAAAAGTLINIVFLCRFGYGSGAFTGFKVGMADAIYICTACNNHLIGLSHIISNGRVGINGKGSFVISICKHLQIKA